MRSTWRRADREQWTTHHWLIELLNAHPVDLDKPIPVHAKNDKIPYLPQWSQHLWVLFYAFIPLALHQAWYTFGFGPIGRIGAFSLYFMAFNVIVIREVRMLRLLGHKYGFLDGDKHERDGVPDIGVGRVAASLYKTTGSRLLMAVLLSYNPEEPPALVLADWKWWLCACGEVGLYSIVLDFFFYSYHRALHETDFLWKYHRTHHLTKHPNSLLSAYADHEQEFFDMVGVPFMTYLSFRAMGLPLGFYEWWICHQYVAFTEVWGHSGLRVHLTAPSTLNWLLRMFDADIAVEDHDLHHRNGWRKSHNYGKQTRLWDRAFGTCRDRIESVPDNIDYLNQARMPIFEHL